MSIVIPSGTGLTPACYVTSAYVKQMQSNCFRAGPADATKNECWCNQLAVESLFEYCSPVENVKSQWFDLYTLTLEFRKNSCAAAHLPLPTDKPLYILPDGIPNPLATKTTSSVVSSTSTDAATITITTTVAPVSSIYIHSTTGVLNKSGTVSISISLTLVAIIFTFLS
ncbi:UNVERIFIED_CONTAM: hypothetical protein HDU68_003557 [Siphonaria sp. JEL0065]|nr:hypothetical protein HDU68_003557 [Siphonaria sp. JEL0065]